MFEENEQPVIDEITENVEEQTTEEIVEDVPIEGDGQEPVPTVEQPPERVYTKKEVDDIKVRYKQRVEKQIRKEYDKKYGKLETVLKAGTGENDLTEIANSFESFYIKKGVNIPKYEINYNDEEAEILADADAKKIIELGYDEVKDEVDRLAELGVDNMSSRDKFYFTKLAQYRKNEENKMDLAAIGVNDDVLKDNDFVEYEKKLNPSLSMKEKYEMYCASKPKKEFEKMGSMKSGPVNTVKERYTEEEIRKLSLEDLDKPGVFEAVRRSMTGQN